MAIKFTDSDVKSIIASGAPVVIDFWATWCGPCMRMSPVIDELAQQYEGQVQIGKYNIEEETELSDEYRIMSIPRAGKGKMVCNLYFRTKACSTTGLTDKKI